MPDQKPIRRRAACPDDPDGRPIWVELVCPECLHSARGVDTLPAPWCPRCDVKMLADDFPVPRGRRADVTG